MVVPTGAERGELVNNYEGMSIREWGRSVVLPAVLGRVQKVAEKVIAIYNEPWEFSPVNSEFDGYRTIFQNEQPDGTPVQGFMANAEWRFGEDKVVNAVGRAVRWLRGERQQAQQRDVAAEPDWIAVFKRVHSSSFLTVDYLNRRRYLMEVNAQRMSAMQADEGYQDAAPKWDIQIADAQQRLDRVLGVASPDPVQVEAAERGLRSFAIGKAEMEERMRHQFGVMDEVSIFRQAALDVLSGGASQPREWAIPASRVITQ